MSVPHKSLRHEILFILGRASEPLDSGQIYERCTLAEEVKRVSDALWILRSEGKVAFAEGEGRKRYVLASGVAAPAPAGKAGRPQELPVAPVPITGIRPSVEIPTLGDPGISLDGAAGKAQRAQADKPQTVTVHEALAGATPGADAAKLANTILATVRKQLSEQAIHSELLEAHPAPVINIHIAQIDFHLGGL